MSPNYFKPSTPEQLADSMAMIASQDWDSAPVCFWFWDMSEVPNYDLENAVTRELNSNPRRQSSPSGTTTSRPTPGSTDSPWKLSWRKCLSESYSKVMLVSFHEVFFYISEVMIFRNRVFLQQNFDFTSQQICFLKKEDVPIIFDVRKFIRMKVFWYYLSLSSLNFYNTNNSVSNIFQ